MQRNVHLSRAIQDALSSLPDRDLNEFYQDLENEEVYNHSHLMSVVQYNSENTPSYDSDLLPEGLSCSDIDALIAVPDNHLGYLSGTCLILNVTDTANSVMGRLIIFDKQSLDEEIDGIYPESGLTPAEKRALYQIVCGYTAKEAADLDNVKTETKRTQFQSVRSKTSLGRQADIATYTVTRLLMDLQTAETDKNTHRALREYHKQYMPSSVRLHVVIGENGQHHRMFDMGPVDGVPFITFHPQVLPYIRTEDIKLFQQSGIRFIWPLRIGQLAPEDPKVSYEQYESAYMETVQLASSLISSEDRLNILGVLCGAQYAIKFAQRHPEKISLFVILSATYSEGTSKGLFASWRDGMVRITSNNQLIKQMLIRFMRRKLSDRDVFKKYLFRLNSGCKANIEILEREFSTKETTIAMQTRILNSEQSMTHDFIPISFPCWELLKELKCRIHFIHGKHDPINSLKDVRKLADLHEAPIHVIEDAGHMVYYDHLQTLCQILNRIVNSEQHESSRDPLLNSSVQ